MLRHPAALTTELALGTEVHASLVSTHAARLVPEPLESHQTGPGCSLRPEERSRVTLKRGFTKRPRRATTLDSNADSRGPPGLPVRTPRRRTPQLTAAEPGAAFPQERPPQPRGRGASWGDSSGHTFPACASGVRGPRGPGCRSGGHFPPVKSSPSQEQPSHERPCRCQTNVIHVPKQIPTGIPTGRL